MKWRFSAYPLDMVETDVTQRDQFKNDDVDLADSLGRVGVHLNWTHPFHPNLTHGLCA